jgi:hypothetical protein
MATKNSALPRVVLPAVLYFHFSAKAGPRAASNGTASHNSCCYARGIFPGDVDRELKVLLIT